MFNTAVYDVFPHSTLAFSKYTVVQAPMDFVLRGVLRDDSGEEEPIGLELIEGYALKVFKLQCLISILLMD